MFVERSHGPEGIGQRGGIGLLESDAVLPPTISEGQTPLTPAQAETANGEKVTPKPADQSAGAEVDEALSATFYSGNVRDASLQVRTPKEIAAAIADRQAEFEANVAEYRRTRVGKAVLDLEPEWARVGLHVLSRHGHTTAVVPPPHYR